MIQLRPHKILRKSLFVLKSEGLWVNDLAVREALNRLALIQIDFSKILCSLDFCPTFYQEKVGRIAILSKKVSE